MTTASTTLTETRQLLVVDLGKKQTKKKLKRLRKGKGPLLSKVSEMIDELREEGVITGAVQPIVVVVREKPKTIFGR